MSFFRFRRRVRLGHHLWLNLSKSGVSASAGVRGLTFNSGGRTTVSIPGSGLSYVSTPAAHGRRHPLWWIAVALLAVYLLAALGRTSL